MVFASFILWSDVAGSPLDIVVHKTAAFIERAVQDKVQMIVHQRKCKNDNLIRLENDIDAVHSADEIGIIVENYIHKLPICGEMPAILDLNNLSFNERGVNSKIRYDPPEQFFFYLHLISRAASGCSDSKIEDCA